MTLHKVALATDVASPGVKPAAMLVAGECLAPVTCGGAPGRDMTLLIQRELFAQKEVFCREGWAGVQIEAQKAPSITHKREEGACKR